MCNCDLPTGSMCVRQRCRDEVTLFPHERHDPHRRTGRTTASIRTALFAALMGRRVLFVAHTEQYAKDCCAQAIQMLRNQEAVTGVANVQLSISARCITFYREDGQEIGVLRFESMSCDLERFTRGLRGRLIYNFVHDHHVDELLAEKARKERELADSNIIKELMRKHGWSKVEDHIPGPVRKLVFRT